MQGEPLDADTFTWATDTFDVPVVNAYGQTETGSTWTYPVTGVEALKAGSVGTAVPGHDVRGRRRRRRRRSRPG